MAGVAAYAGYAVLANTIYGAATGESGGFVGELFGVQDSIDDKTNQAKQEAADRQAALVAASQQKTAAPAALEVAPQVAPVLETPAVQTVVKPVAPVPPVIEKPAVMPSQKDAAVVAARKASIAEQRRRQGRASTILTGSGSGDLLGA